MTAMTDSELLQQYAQTGSQEAFAELVSHHSNWIYSAALRLVRRRDWAQDVTQAVFILLAQRAKKLITPTLNGWLFNVTRYCAANILREENRRQKRERQAAIMNSQIRDASDDSKWEEIAPILDQTVGRLRSADRDAVLLRFYQQKSMSEVGEALGVSEDAARKRVAKALAKLRSFMSARGILLPAAGAAITLLSDRTTHAAPTGLGNSCLPGAGTANAANIAQGVNHMLFALKLKFVALAIVALSLIPAGVWIGLRVSAAEQPTTPAASVAPVAPSVPPVPAEVDDAAITPFYTSLTQVIVSVDFSQIDLDALTAEGKKLLATAIGPNNPRRASIEQNVAQSLAILTRTRRAMSNAHVSHIYPIVAELSPTNITGFFVFPIDGNANVEALNHLMMEPAAATPDGKARVFLGRKPPAFLLSQMATAERRPEFADAMSAGTDAAVRIMINPGFFDEIVHAMSTPRTLGLGDMSDPEWATVKWVRMTVNTPPNLSATLIMECADTNSAVTLANMLSAKFSASHANPPPDALPAQVASLIGDVKPVVSGEIVTIDLDQKIMEPILLDWLLSVTRRDATPGKASQHPKPTGDNGL
jgi:RNA polymerase sigma factor (sigma-70 family)